MQRSSRLRWRNFLAFPSWREKSEPDNRAHERREEDKARDARWLIEKRHAYKQCACGADPDPYRISCSSGSVVLGRACNSGRVSRRELEFVTGFLRNRFSLLAASPPGGLCGLLSAKGGLMMGTKKVGAFPSPRKKAIFIITPKIKNTSHFQKNFPKNIFRGSGSSLTRSGHLIQTVFQVKDERVKSGGKPPCHLSSRIPKGSPITCMGKT